jgi:AcrR family transcriptional regulator
LTGTTRVCQLPKALRETADLESGRVQQKARTREALVEAAISLVSKGQDFSVADVADLARVSRTTAYNYFPTKESLYAQAVLTFVARTDYPDFYELFKQSTDVAERVQAVVATSDASVAHHKELYRGMLRVSLESHDGGEVPRRPAFRPQWLTDALAPLRDEMDRKSFGRIVSALSLCVGIEPDVTLRDVCGLSADEARRTKLWAAQALLGAAIADARIKKRTGRV